MQIFNRLRRYLKLTDSVTPSLENLSDGTHWYIEQTEKISRQESGRSQFSIMSFDPRAPKAFLPSVLDTTKPDTLLYTQDRRSSYWLYSYSTHPWADENNPQSVSITAYKRLFFLDPKRTGHVSPIKYGITDCVILIGYWLRCSRWTTIESIREMPWHSLF